MPMAKTSFIPFGDKAIRCVIIPSLLINPVAQQELSIKRCSGELIRGIEGFGLVLAVFWAFFGLLFVSFRANVPS